ncbi:MAG: fibronectin type III domain-containing protein, partial [Anaerolineae bacterium]|nr:fibronectin type III domain-containing protein [Anaerolineae bacterium]
MLFHNFFCKIPYKYLAYLLILSIIFLAMSIAVFAAFAVSLTASPDLPDSDTQVALEWNPVAGAQMYEILRNDGGGFVSVETIDPDAVLEPTTYSDSGLNPDTSYTYQLRAYLDAEMQNEVALTYNEAIVRTTEMIRPDGLSAVYNINTRMVTLSWESASAATTGCEVRVGDDAGAIVATEVYNPAKTVLFITSEVNPVNYVVISNDGAGGHASDASESIAVTPATPPTVTAAVTGGVVTVTWGAFPQISDFQLERSKWGGTSWGVWEPANTSLSGTGTTNSPASGGIYRYRLTAKSNGDYAGHSNASGNVTCPKAPSSPACTIVDGNRIDLAWTNDSGNESALKVERKQSDGNYLVLATLSKESTSYI